MVSFSKFIYKFKPEDRELYFRLIEHYFPDVPLWMGTSDDTESSTSYEEGTTAKVIGTRQAMEERYQSRYNTNDYERLVILTKLMWSQRPMVYAFEPIPEQTLTDIVSNYQEPYETGVVESICSLVEKRKDNGNENRWDHPFKQKLSVDKLIPHFASAALLTGVNKAFYTPSSNTIYCYVDNCNFIQVNLNGASDVTMPELDLDDGMSYRGDSHEDEWDEAFFNWLQSGRKENYIFKFKPTANSAKKQKLTHMSKNE